MISWSEKERLRARYGYRCGYCALSEAQAGRELTIDHFKPQCAGGGDESENLVYACGPCNHFKGAQWNPDSPPVLHPLRDDVSRHITRGACGVLVALTQAGARHIATLRLNRLELVRRRCGITSPRRRRAARRQ